MMKFSIYDCLESRIMILDGGMGTLVQGYGLSEGDYRGARFASWGRDLNGCNDILVITSPDHISRIHEAYLGAGADIISTDTFNANAVSLADYGLQAHVREINRAGAALARAAADRFTLANPAKPRFVAGSMGPTGKSASMSPDVGDPGARGVTFDELQRAYTEQALGLIEGGADVFLVETIFDTLNAKAALRAIEAANAEKGTKIPVMISATVADRSGRILSGQTVEAFYTSLCRESILSAGLNCAFGAEQMRPYLERLAALTACRVSAHPNAGLPNVMGGYDETPDSMAACIEQYLREGLLNIVGGCCGTTPAHIGAIAAVAAKYSPRPLPPSRNVTALSGLERMEVVAERNFVNVGERTNVAGSAAFARLVREGKMEDAVAVARRQVESGAQVIDVCMDDGMIDGPAAMTAFLNLAAAEPDVARVPVMIDSSSWETIEAGLKCTQGKSIVNSISLKEGQAAFLRQAAAVRSYGAAAVVMLFDEKGQADTYERKIEVAGRAYALLTGAGFPPEDIIFDPNVLAVATGIPEHDSYGVAFIEACRWIKQNLPHAKVSGGISNLSFSFRGNNAVREAMHSVFLYHAVAAGLDMGIVNPAMIRVYADIPADLLELAGDVVLNRRPDAAERLAAYAAGAVQTARAADASPEWRNAPAGERIAYAMLNGAADHVAEDVMEVYDRNSDPLSIINTMLMPAMESVGRLFGEGKMFLPQVVKSARVMKAAVSALEPYMDPGGNPAAGAGRVLIATVKGDVHDIGKNIASVVMSCNGYQMEDMGVMVDAQAIVDRAAEWGADAVGLSGLITPSLDEMIKVVKLMERRNMKIPVLIGGATTSALHTAVRIAPCYSGPTIHVSDASDNVKVLSQLTGDGPDSYLRDVRLRQNELRKQYESRNNVMQYKSLFAARRNGYVKLPQNVVTPRQIGRTVFCDYSISEVIPYIDWRFFFPAWGLKGQYPDLLDSPDKGEEARKLLADAQAMLARLAEERSLELHAAFGIFPASSYNDDIWVLDEDNRRVVLPMLRNQEDGQKNNLCVADYVLAHQMIEEGDFIGLFVVTAGVGLDVLTKKYRKAGDDYNAIMCKLLADRLTEALAEVVHAYVRREMWGFEKGVIEPERAIYGDYRGMRLALGYPACPDHSLKKEIFRLLHATEAMPVKLTENYMIQPGESLCGLIVSDAASQYFSVGRVDREQLEDYAARRGMSVSELRKLMPNNV